MYCVKCGVELADSEKICPLCETVVFHPEIVQPEGEPLYPPHQSVNQKTYRLAWMLILSIMFLPAIAIPTWTDWSMNGSIVWSGYVIAAILMFYIIVMLPVWFEKPCVWLLLPLDFTSVILFLLYIDLKTDGAWFLSFAFPTVGTLGVLTLAATILLRLIKHGRLYIVGGMLILLGGFCVLVEFLLNITFFPNATLVWSFYPLSAGIALGIATIVVASNRPMLEWLHKKLFF